MKGPKQNYVVCIRADASSDIEVRKVYEILPDETAAKRGHLRIIDESGQDYLYPEEYFVPVQLPEKGVRTLKSLASSTRADTDIRPTQKTRRR